METPGRPDRVEDGADLLRRAEEHRLRGEHDQQFALLDRIIRLDPSAPLPYFAKGSSLAQLGRYQEAEAPLRTCVRLNPKDPIPRIFLAKVLYQLGNEREAETIQRSLLEERLDPIVEVSVRSDLARVLGRSERSEEALPQVEQAIAITERADIPALASQRHALLHLQSGLLFNVKRTRDAVQCLERVVGLSPDNGRYWYDLACGYSLLERGNDAFNALDRACNLASEWRAKAAQNEDFAFPRSRDAARFAAITGTTPPEEEELGRNLLKEMREEPRIFISYRRTDAVDAARSLKRRLEERNRKLQVFLDEASLEPGAQFSEHLASWIERAHLVLVLISPVWQTADGATRIRDPQDVVHRELAHAFRHDVSVVPILLAGTRMPAAETLPPGIRGVAGTQALTLQSARSNADLDRLATAVEQIFSDRIARMQVPSGEGKVIYTAVHLPPIFRMKAGATQGVPLEPFAQWYGSWENRARAATTEFVVRFTTEEHGGGRFAGTFEEVVRGRRQGEQRIQGRWGVAQDEETRLIVGIYLDFTLGSRNQQALLPCHRKVGDAYVGTSHDGTEHVTRNLRPMPEGF